MGALVAAVDKRGQNAPKIATTMLGTLTNRHIGRFGVASPTAVEIQKNLQDLNDQKLESQVAIGYGFSRILDQDKPQPLLLKDAAMAFGGRIWPSGTSEPDLEVVARKLRPKYEASAEIMVRETNGSFVFVIAERERLIAGRDPIGANSLYYGENTDLAALASERKALWRIGLRRVESFPPGSIAVVDKEGFKIKSLKTLALKPPRQTSMQTAAKNLQRLLRQSIKERVSGLKEVAVAFSGGLDSSIVAFLAKQSNLDVHLIHVSLEDQPETEYAVKTAEELGLPIHICLFSEEDLERIIPRVLWIIEDSNPLNLSIGAPIFWAAEKAASMKLKVMLAGQAADELFAGYRRYVDDYLSFGEERVRKELFHDIASIHETNLERDYKLCNFHGVELRLPFADYRIAEFAMNLPTSLKIEHRPNGLRKIVLRKVAKDLGLPEPVVKKPKKAVQYTTGVDKALKRLAKKSRMTVNEYLRKIFEDSFKQMV